MMTPFKIKKYKLRWNC